MPAVARACCAWPRVWLIPLDCTTVAAGRRCETSGFAPASLDSRVQLLEGAVAKTARTDGGPERNILVFGVHSSVEAASKDERLARFVPPDLLATTPYVLLGDAEAIVYGYTSGGTGGG